MRDPGRGLLGRRPVHAAGVKYIGKESNSLEDAKAGRIFDLDDMLNEYRDPGSEWPVSVQWVLKQIPATTINEKTGISERAIKAARNGRRPHLKNGAKLLSVAGDYARAHLGRHGLPAPQRNEDACEVFFRSFEGSAR